MIEARNRHFLGAAVLGALIGSKLVFVATYPALILAAFEGDNGWFLAWLSGDSAPGALLGGRLAVWLAGREGRAVRVADALVLPVAAALLVLSLGVFFWALRGDGVGGPTGLPWGVDFGDGVARHPVMLYEALGLFAMVAMIRTMSPGASGAGERSRLFLLVFCGFSMLIGFLKSPFHLMLLAEAIKLRPQVYAHLMTAEQWLCAIVVAAMLTRRLASRVRGAR